MAITPASVANLSRTLVQSRQRRQRRGMIGRKPEPPLDVVEFARVEIGADPDPWQVEVLYATLDHDRIAVVASRQSGKSTIVAIALAYLFIHVPDFRVVVLSRTLAQASYFMRRVKRAVLRYMSRGQLEVINTLSIMHQNGSLCVCVPCRDPDAARGYDPHAVALDEAAFVPQATIDAVRPMIAATQGALILISSPNGPQGEFYESVEGRLKHYYWRRKVTVEECPRITDEFLAEERISKGPLMFDQEYYCKFLQIEGAFFPAGTIDLFAQAEDIFDRSFEDVPYAAIQPALDAVKAAFDARRFKLEDERFYVPKPKRRVDLWEPEER
jgi:Terminase large subunit, T4likevirus-type, N-terminal